MPPAMACSPAGPSTGDREAVDHSVVVRLPRVHARRPESGLVRCVGEQLRLKRNPVAHAVDMPSLANQRAVEEVAGIDLDPGLIGKYLQHAARHRVLEPGGELWFGRLARVEHEVVIDPAPDDDLRVAPVTDNLVQHAPGREVERRPRNGLACPRWNQGSVDWRIVRRRYRQPMAQNPAWRTLAGE